MKKLLAALVPYVAVLVGLHWLGSAWTAMLAYHAAMVVFLFLRSKPNEMKKLLWGWSFKRFALSAPLYLGAGAAIYLLWAHVRLGELSLTAALGEVGLEGAVLLGFAIYYCLINPPLEELFWRGKLGSDSKWLAWQDLMFGGYHGLVMALFVAKTWAVISVLVLVTAAWLWRKMGSRWKGLAIPVATHFIADVGVMAAVWLLLD